MNFRKEIFDIAKKNIELIKGNDQSPIVSLHVRRGDYLNENGWHHNLSIDYFKKSIKRWNYYFKFFFFIEFTKSNAFLSVCCSVQSNTLSFPFFNILTDEF